MQSIPPLISTDQTEDENGEAINAEINGIVGLPGEVDSATDYAYAFASRLAEGSKHRFPLDTNDPTPQPGSIPAPEWEKYGFKLETGPWLKAERASGECVVIDLRRLEKFFRNISA